jgi:5-methyltetrahydropteroyltriglutamate--homocysteine methyltransferase
MNVIVDDVGSFPLPSAVDRNMFNRAYALARQMMVKGEDVRKDEFLLHNFYEVIIDSFRKKLITGLDTATYPQHYDMNLQFSEPIRESMSKGTYIVDKTHAIIPEVRMIEQEAKELSEEFNRKISLRVCITGPMELYLKEIGTTAYEDILLMFAETVRNFAENAILNTKYVKVDVICLDEPSFGFQDINTSKDTILEIMEEAYDFQGVKKQIHIHSSSHIADLAEIKNLDVLSFEYAGSPKSIENVSRKMLETANKQIRVGVSRTDINSIIAEHLGKSVTQASAELVESEETIKKRFMVAKKKYGERMTFAGPDCGLGGWPTQEQAQLLLVRTVDAVKNCHNIS